MIARRVTLPRTSFTSKLVLTLHTAAEAQTATISVAIPKALAVYSGALNSSFDIGRSLNSSDSTAVNTEEADEAGNRVGRDP